VGLQGGGETRRRLCPAEETEVSRRLRIASRWEWRTERGFSGHRNSKGLCFAVPHRDGNGPSIQLYYYMYQRIETPNGPLRVGCKHSTPANVIFSPSENSTRSTKRFAMIVRRYTQPNQLHKLVVPPAYTRLYLHVGKYIRVSSLLTTIVILFLYS
jgi:hypothetical protein